MASQDIRSTLMTQRVQHGKQSSAALKAAFQAHIAGHRNIHKNYETFVEKMKEAAGNESSADLQTAMYVLTSATDNVEALRVELLCGRHEDLLVKRLSEYPKSSYSPATNMIKDRDQTLTNYETARKKIETMQAQGKAHGPAFDQAQLELQSHAQRVENVEFMFEENSQLYELQRLRDTKRLVSEYIAAQIAFHCKAIENLSAAAQAVASFDPDHGMDALGAVLSGSQPPRRPEEEAPASTDHAREIMEGLPTTAVLDADSTKTTGGLERGGSAPTRGVTFRRTFDPNSPGPGGALGGFVGRQESGALVQDGGSAGRPSSARSDASGDSGAFFEGGASRSSTNVSAASAGSVDPPPTIPEARQPAAAAGGAAGAQETKSSDAPKASEGSKGNFFGRMFGRSKPPTDSTKTPGTGDQDDRSGGDATATQ